MKLILCLSALLLTGHLSGQGKIFSSVERHPYDHDHPVPVPEKFEIPGINNAWHITFAPDGKSYYFVTVDTIHKREVIKYSQFQDGRWTIPVMAGFSGRYRIETPRLSPDGGKFFFTYAESGHEDIYVMDKTDNGWSEPRDPGPPVNTAEFEGCPSTSLNGNLYFFSFRYDKFRIYCSRFVNGNYTDPEALEGNLNRDDIGEFYIAPDESYLLFDIYTPPDSCQLHISFNRNGSWSVPQNLGKKINFTKFQKRPSVSPDGNYLFYTCNGVQYQVDFKPLLDSLISNSSLRKKQGTAR